MSLEDIRRQRLEKIARLRASGVEPYAYAYAVTHRAGQVLEWGDAVTAEPGERVRVAGRLMSQRAHGKAGFGHLLDASGRLQIYARADQLGPERFAAFLDLDVGDWVGAEGPVFRTKTGEITVRVESFELLAKAVRPLPEKWHGLRNPETRYRQRYVDLFMNPHVRATFRARAAAISTMRRELDVRGYLEVETPILQPLYGGAFARPFVTHHNALGRDLYLRISNELYLKRLIVGGLERVYEVARDFRNEGMDRTHNPEFTMLECYEAFSDYHAMMRLTEELCCACVRAVHGEDRLGYQGEVLEFAPPWPRISMVEAVGEAVGEDVSDLDPERLRAACRRHSIEVRGGAGHMMDELFGALVQPRLVQPTLVLDYPREISPLARAKRGAPKLVERFEAMIGGVELANAFSEQNDPVAQLRAFEDQMRLREAGDEEAQPLDHDYVRALEYGMPPTGGLGIGVDRLAMLLTGERGIRDVLLFPQLRPEEGLEDEEASPAREGAAER
jgi:lysyl-tRNA synthetase class 2